MIDFIGTNAQYNIIGILFSPKSLETYNNMNAFVKLIHDTLGEFQTAD